MGIDDLFTEVDDRKNINKRLVEISAVAVEKIALAVDAGDLAAAKLALDKVHPNAKETPVEISVTPPADLSEVPAYISAVLGEAGAGRITATYAKTLISAVSDYSTAVAAVELEDRIKELELLLEERT